MGGIKSRNDERYQQTTQIGSPHTTASRDKRKTIDVVLWLIRVHVRVHCINNDEAAAEDRITRSLPERERERVRERDDSSIEESTEFIPHRLAADSSLKTR